ncbi:hypothetical protein ACROSR_01610 [Roseovarius tibetensis]|uniref:hypothetical protein n=1 Tax=Roseovarius tibetensis TaxID=2685897 RepID=UPI003D7FEBA5
MTTPEPEQTRRRPAPGANGWREVAHDCAGADGIALEHLIDLQRTLARQPDDAR